MTHDEMHAATPSPSEAMLEAAVMHVPFDGWSEATFRAAATDAGVGPDLARALYPRGAVDLALAYHAAGDVAMMKALAARDLGEIRYSERVALAIRLRLEAADKELVRRGSTLFSLPQHAADGARALWQTADRIWTALGDTSTDVNWYTKRATLSGVYGATVLYWLGDDSEGHAATWAFLDRRIEGVMRIEKTKASLRQNKLAQAVLAGPLSLIGRIRAPGNGTGRSAGLPGRWSH